MYSTVLSLIWSTPSLPWLVPSHTYFSKPNPFEKDASTSKSMLLVFLGLGPGFRQRRGFWKLSEATQAAKAGYTEYV